MIEEEKENKEEICRKIIERFLEDKKLNIEELKKEEDYLKEIIRILNNENNISYRVMEKHLKLSREKLRKLNVE